jgi:pimeloyl-ACP methyl ester carboxylesterase
MAASGVSPAGGAMSFSEPAPSGPFRGERVDIGGRNLRVVRQGPAAADGATDPTVLFEAGAFGGAAEWAVIQDKLSPRLRSLAYDRAGLGYSDPGPEPRDTKTVVDDLEALLAAAGERAPYILVAHSMAPIYAYAFAKRHPAWVKGLVLVDATPPESMSDPMVAGMIRNFADSVSFASITAAMGMNGFAQMMMGDEIGLPAEARAEKAASFVSPRHNRWAAAEARDWLKNGIAVRALGQLSPDLPVAVVSAGPGHPSWKRMQAAPAQHSLYGHLQDIEAATHASIMGPRYGDAIVRAIDHVNAVVTARA